MPAAPEHPLKFRKRILDAAANKAVRGNDVRGHHINKRTFLSQNHQALTLGLTNARGSASQLFVTQKAR
jgi:hypothetical protein